MAAIRHAVPRLDAPDRLWLLPLPVAKWLGAGLVTGPLVEYGYATVYALPLDQGWNEPLVWLVWALAGVLAAIGAFVRPGGLDAAQWVTVLAAYSLVPRRAVWRPLGEG